MKKQYFDKLIENAKVIQEDEDSVIMKSKVEKYEFEIYAERSNDFEVYVNEFGKMDGKYWIELEPTEEQISFLQDLIENNKPSERPYEDRYINKYDYFGVKPQDFI